VHAPLPPSAARLLFDSKLFGNPEVDVALAPLGLRSRELLVLTMIGSDDDATAGAIGRRLHIAHSRISQLAARLAAEALVVRAGRTSDSDGHRLGLTPAGLEVHTMAVEAVWNAARDFAEPLDPSAHEALRQFLDARNDPPS
jgi:DNA-binding MarR family transcriptional regulator